MKKKKQAQYVKAYKNIDFLTASDGRILRILSEYLEPSARFRKHGIRSTVVFFGSARTLNRKDATRNLKEVEERVKAAAKPGRTLLNELSTARGLLRMVPYYEAAGSLSFRLTEWSLRQKKKANRFVVASGGGGGIMCAANEGARRAGGQSIGMNISIPFEQHPNPHVSPKLGFEFHYFFMRKFWFLYLSRAIIVFPGGFGTLDEFMEVLTLIQTGKLRKKIPVVLFGIEFWKSILDFEHMVEWGVISPEDRKLFFFTDSVEDAYQHIIRHLKQNQKDFSAFGTPLTLSEESY